MSPNPANFLKIKKWLEDDDFYNPKVLSQDKKVVLQGERKALSLFHQASKRVPAYKDFLFKNGIDPIKIRSIKDYQQVIPTTKENYIDNYDFSIRSWDGKITSNHMVSVSSGTTGEPHYWPRDLESEIEGAYAHELIFRDVCKTLDKYTLFINGFAMGNWIAGTFTQACVNLVSLKGYFITLMTPGYNFEAILKILQDISSQFERIIITGHTPFLKEIAEQSIKAGLDWKKVPAVIMLGTGQAVTENWRSYITQLLGSKQGNNSFFNLYGSADAALMGFETPETVLIRKFFSKNPGFTTDYFGSNRLPSIFNFDPRLTFFEEINKELHITKYSGCPLIRYNIHDEGGVVKYREMTDDLDDFGYIGGKSNRFDIKLPFVYLFGRDKFMVKVYGANIYSEHIQHALSHSKLQPLLTGRYLVQTDYDKDNNPVLNLRAELNKGIEGSSELADLIKETFIEEIRKINNEYNYVLGEMGAKAHPKVYLYKNGHPRYFPKGEVKKNA